MLVKKQVVTVFLFSKSIVNCLTSGINFFKKNEILFLLSRMGNPIRGKNHLNEGSHMK